MTTKDISVVMAKAPTGLMEGPGFLYFTKDGSITLQNGESPTLRAVTKQQFKAWDGLVKSKALSAERVEIYKKENGHWAHREA